MIKQTRENKKEKSVIFLEWLRKKKIILSFKLFLAPAHNFHVQ